MSYKKMNPEAKRVWVNELRSGRYEQTDEYLRSGGAFCCLGVLCDLSGAAEWKGETYDGEIDLAPDDVIDWAGLTHNRQIYLAKMNDNGASFSEIADWIEKHL